MRRYILIVFLLLCSLTLRAVSESVQIDESHFPDTVFRGYVSNTFDNNGDGLLDDEEISGVTYIYMWGEDVSSLEGIGYFPNLTGLTCVRSSLTNIDLSGNLALTSLNCQYNQIEVLDVSHNSLLQSLNCANNAISELDLHSNLSLTSLNCRNNELHELDLRSNTELVYLICSYNSFTSLNLYYNTNLVDLDCSYNSLKTLDISSNQKIEGLKCSNNNLTSLDISENTRLSRHAYYCISNHYYADFVNGTLDLSSLPGLFDPSKAYNWKGATEENGILTVTGSGTISYQYNVGRDGFDSTFYIKANYTGLRAPSISVPTTVFAGQRLELLVDIDPNAEYTDIKLYKLDSDLNKQEIDQWQISDSWINTTPVITTGGEDINPYIFVSGETYQFEAYSTTLNKKVTSDTSIYQFTVSENTLPAPEIQLSKSQILMGEDLEVTLLGKDLTDAYVYIESADYENIYWLENIIVEENKLTGTVNPRGTGRSTITAYAMVGNIPTQATDTVTFEVIEYGTIPEAELAINNPYPVGKDITFSLTNRIQGAKYTVRFEGLSYDMIPVDENGNFTIPGYLINQPNRSYRFWINGEAPGYNGLYMQKTLSTSGDYAMVAPQVTADKDTIKAGEELVITVFSSGSDKLRMKGSCGIGGSLDEEWNQEFDTTGDRTTIRLRAPMPGVHDDVTGEWRLQFSGRTGNTWTPWSDVLSTTIQCDGRVKSFGINLPDYIYMGEDFVFTISSADGADVYEVTIYGDGFTYTEQYDHYGRITIPGNVFTKNGYLWVEVVARKSGYVPAYAYDSSYVLYRDIPEEQEDNPFIYPLIITKEWVDGMENGLTLHLFHSDGSVSQRSQPQPRKDGKIWTYSYWFNVDEDYYVEEEPIPGYFTKYENVGRFADVTDRAYHGGKIINYKVPKTGDTGHFVVFVIAAIISVALIVLIIRKKDFYD